MKNLSLLLVGLSMFVSPVLKADTWNSGKVSRIFSDGARFFFELEGGTISYCKTANSQNRYVLSPDDKRVAMVHLAFAAGKPVSVLGSDGCINDGDTAVSILVVNSR